MSSTDQALNASQPNGAGTADSSATSPGTSKSIDLTSLNEKVDRLAAMFEQTVPKIEGRIGDLGRDIGKVREKVKQPDAPAGDPPKTSEASVEERIAAAMRYGAMHTKLPAAAQAQLDKMQQEGATFSELNRAAAIAISMMPAPASGAQAGDPPRAPTGAAATAASRSSPVHPRTLAEYQEVAKSDPERKKQLDADPTFHLDELPRR